MKKRAWVFAALCLILSASLAHAGTTPADTAPPSVAFATTNDTIFINLYAVQFRLQGIALDDLSGVDRVDVAFVADQTGMRFDARADLGCDDESQRSCNWVILPPLLPGRYTATARAADIAGNLQAAGPTISIIVA